ncbi:glycosyltransferase [Clostridium sp. YIM B02569]|uniref:glycosyltransferase n=1 Tax=Clostridium sp. YIM B02569 TaxID=2911967 RepID=UPI001EE9B03E|nr:glycosyltransferase [Clostridium sp. YIM B02569]
MKIDNTLIEINRPLVSILLAVYKPNESWFIEQLISLNEQTYENIELLVYDDCPEFPASEELIKRYITNFSYVIVRGLENKGSNKAFEELTKMATGDFFAYCDQDDIWESNKIKILLNTLKKDNSLLVYSDMSVIDEEGKVIAKTLIEKKPRINYVSGETLFPKFFFSNCVSGCCLLIDKKIAKKSIPFSEVTIHDQWLCMMASYYGKISFINAAMVRYRMHENNQTGSLRGIYNKKDYYNLRVDILKQRINEIKKHINNINLNEIENFCNARINKNILKILKYSYLDTKEAYFEIIIKYIPNWLFKIIINKLK